MKIERELQKFEPIHITIETLDELKWLTAISNMSITSAYNSAKEMGFEIARNDLTSDIQDKLYNVLTGYIEEYK